VVPKPETALL